MRRVRALVVARGRTLEPRHRGVRTGDAARGEAAGHHVIALSGEEVVAVCADHDGAAGQLRLQARIVEASVHRRRQHAEPGPLADVPSHAGREVVGQRLHFHVPARVAGGRVGEFPARDRVDEIDRPGPARLAGQLRRAEDRRRRRPVDEFARRSPLRRAADPPGIEQGGVRAVEPHVAARPVPAEAVERLRALDEERALLVVERLERREVDDGRIDFDLAEVRIHGGVDGQVARHTPLQVEASGRRPGSTVVERVAGLRRALGFPARRHVRQHFEVPAASNPVEPLEFTGLGDDRVFLLWDEGPPALLVLPLHHPHDVQPPDLALGGREPELREGNPHLRAPALVVDRHGGLPDAVPGVVLIGVVVEDAVADGAGGGHGEHRPGQVVVERVEADDDPVGDPVGVAVAPRQAAGDFRRFRVEHPRAHVDGVVVVDKAYFGLLGGWFPLVRVTLQESARRRGLLPVGLVEAAIDRDRARGAEGGNTGHGRRGCGLGPGGGCRQDERQQQRRQGRVCDVVAHRTPRTRAGHFNHYLDGGTLNPFPGRH